MFVNSLFTTFGAVMYAVGYTHANPVPPATLNSLWSDGRLTTLAPLITPPPPPQSGGSNLHTNGHIIQDSYIVVLKDHLRPHHVKAHHDLVHSLHKVDEQNYSTLDSTSPQQQRSGIVHKFDIGKKAHGKKTHRGYSGQFSENVLDLIRSMEEVKYVEKDSLVWASEVERGAPWGLARISHRKPLSFGTFNRYEYDGHGGEGVNAYVIDTGVNIDHVELEGRAKWGKTIPTDPDQDLNGHGSHVAGTIASAKYGVAKKATIIAVKVLGAGGSGTMSDVIAGVAWAADHAAETASIESKNSTSKFKGSVANMSLGGGKSPGLDDAVNAAVDDGLHFAVAAGNDNRDACSYSPAGAENAITVGASTIADERAYFSNHGKCVDVFAPGLNILSIWNTGNKSLNTISGTSMASPHVAGLAAYFLSLYPESFAPASEDFSEEAYNLVMSGETTQASSNFLTSGAQVVFGGAAKQWARFSGKGASSSSSIRGAKPLTPKALKKALEKFATKNALIGDLPAGTPNILINNNFTSSSFAEAMVSSLLDNVKA